MFATVHTNDASTAIDRIIDVFPTDRQAQIRVQGHEYDGQVAQGGGVGQVAAYRGEIAHEAARELGLEGLDAGHGDPDFSVFEEFGYRRRGSYLEPGIVGCPGRPELSR